MHVKKHKKGTLIEAIIEQMVTFSDTEHIKVSRKHVTFIWVGTAGGSLRHSAWKLCEVIEMAEKYIELDELSKKL